MVEILKTIIKIIIAALLPSIIAVGGAIAVKSTIGVSSDMALIIVILTVLCVVGAFKLRHKNILKEIKEWGPDWIEGIIGIALLIIIAFSFIGVIYIVYTGVKLVLSGYTLFGKIITVIQILIVVGVILIIWLYKRKERKETEERRRGESINEKTRNDN